MNKNFKMQIVDVFAITGRGTVITGCVEVGEISINEQVYINNKMYTVAGLEANRQLINKATAGMNIGILIKGANVHEFEKGSTVTNSLHPIENRMDGNELTCKSCGGIVEREGDIYICNKCGETFKDISDVENGNVELINKSFNVEKKTSSVANSEKIQNLYQVARRAKNDKNYEQAEKYYDMILIEDPNSWEASYYTTYFNVANCKIGEISPAADKLANCLNSVFNLIEEYASSTEETSAISDIYTTTKNLAELMYASAQNHYARFKDTSNSITEFLYRCDSIYNLLCELGDQLEKRFISNPAIKSMCVEAWKKGIEIKLNYRFWDEPSKQRILSYSDKVKKYDNNYQGVTFNNGGCYVATCVYGSYDCPEVWTLRRFRDFKLAEIWYGRLFINIYYAISPTIVKLFGNTSWFKKLWKDKLDKMVKYLNDKGYEDSRYIDKY